MSREKKKRQHQKSQSSQRFAEPVEELLREIAKDAAGKPLEESLTPDSPLKHLIARVVELAYEEEMTEHLGYERHEPTVDEEGRRIPRSNTRNGSSKKTLRTSHGDVEVKVPRDRNSKFEPQIIPKHSAITKDLEQRVVSMYARGMTTRDLRSHVEEIYGLDVSPMFVSRLVERLDPELKAWRNRPLEQICPIVFVDGIHMKVRHSHGVRSTAAYLVCGYTESGQLQILSICMASGSEVVAESASYWHQVLIELKNRGLEDVLILSADGLSGLSEAVQAVYPNAHIQPCVVHMVRASLRLVNWKDRKKLSPLLRAIYQAPSYEAAELALERFDEQWGQRYPGVVQQWEQNLPRLSQMWSYGPELRRIVYTTNAIENINRQVRKVIKNRGAFPNPNSALRLLTLVLMRINETYAKKKPRREWKAVLNDLHILFSDRLPPQWGHRYQNVYLR